VHGWQKKLKMETGVKDGASAEDLRSKDFTK